MNLCYTVTFFILLTLFLVLSLLSCIFLSSFVLPYSSYKHSTPSSRSPHLRGVKTKRNVGLYSAIYSQASGNDLEIPVPNSLLSRYILPPNPRVILTVDVPSKYIKGVVDMPLYLCHTTLLAGNMIKDFPTKRRGKWISDTLRQPSHVTPPYLELLRVSPLA